MKKLILANWKLNPITIAEAKKLANKIERVTHNTVVLCPPPVLLSSVEYPMLGSQDCFWQDKGAFTGQISPYQLKKLGVKYCLVGHSEKRAVCDSEEQINAKIRALLRYNITPVLCVGYGTEPDEDDLKVTDVIRQQLNMDLEGIDEKKVVVAYEPVWAISSGNATHHLVATSEHAEKIAIFIKSKYKVKTVLYGGSVNYVNAESFLHQEHIDGLLVGAESLIPGHFNKIINL